MSARGGAGAQPCETEPTVSDTGRCPPEPGTSRGTDSRASCPLPSWDSVIVAPRTAPAGAAAAVAVALAARAVLLGRAGRSVLRPLDQLLGLDEPAVLVLRDQLQA